MVAKGDNRRMQRVSEAVREELARLLVTASSDPLLAWATITEVKVAPDLRTARVFFAATGEEEPEAMARGLTKAAPFLQRELGRNLRLRYTPRLSFTYDESFDEGERIEQLIKEVREEEDARLDQSTEAQLLDRELAVRGRVLLATHRNPDGDAIGSLLGLAGILKLKGVAHTAYCPDGVPEVLAFLDGADRVASRLEPDDRFELTILLDTADESLLPDGFPGRDQRGRLVVVDHHKQHGELGDFVIRREASAVGEILFELAEELAWPMDAAVAECLYASIVADTGSFRYSSTTVATHRAAGRLLELGARPWVVASQLFESFPLRRQRLLSRVLETLELSRDGRFAELSATPEMLAEAGAGREDLDGMINFGRAVTGVEVAAMFRVEMAGEIKVSFRSKGRIDVGGLAARFGGGGHRNAAGCTLHDTTLEQAKRTIMSAAAEYLEGLGAEELAKPVS